MIDKNWWTINPRWEADVKTQYMDEILGSKIIFNNSLEFDQPLNGKILDPNFIA